MTDRQPKPMAPYGIAGDLSPRDLLQALQAGWRDFLAHPKFGLFFGGIFALGGIALAFILTNRSQITWLIPVIAGFPLIAPFAAVGLYEVSRRHEKAIDLTWKGVLGALRGRGDDQIMSMGGIIFVAFSFWVIIAHVVFSIFAAEYGAGAETVEFLFTPTGLLMLSVGTAIGGAMAFAFYAITVISLPMLIDQKVDFITAIIVSTKVIRENFSVLILWAIIIAALLIIALLPLFLGLFVILPVLGHATWHLYRRAVVIDP